MALLSSMDSGKFSDIQDSIDHAQTNKITITNSSLKLNLNSKIVVNQGFVFKDYKDVIFSNLEPYTMDEKYVYQPDRLSYDLYGTVDLWYLLLWVNNMSSVIQFTKTDIMIYPAADLDVLVDIIDASKNKLAASQASPMFIPDITLTKIRG